MSAAHVEKVADTQLSDDELKLRANGHKGELPRQFSRLAALSFAFNICNSWVGESATFTAALRWGGGPAVVFSLLVGSLACVFICVGLAELASAFPTSGGQYHFAFMVSSNRHRALMAFITGWVSLAAWCLISAASAVYAAQMFALIASVYHPSYTPTSWQVYLIYIIVLVFCAAIICLLPRKLPGIEQWLFFASITAIIVFFITVLSTSTTKQAAATVFSNYVNQSGWDNGTSFMLSSGTAMYIFIGIDGVIHLAEEIPDSARNVPQVIGLTLLIGFSTAFPWTIAFLFCVTDYDALLNGTQPVFEIFYQSVRNESAATFFICWFLLIYMGATMTGLATTGRQAWAFARDNGTPFAEWMAHVHPTLEVPLNATVAVTVATIVYGALYCGSTSAFNSFLNTAILFIYASYAIPQAILLFRGRNILPERYFNAGRFGAFCNAFSTLWMLLYAVLFCFPAVIPTTVQSMNYVSPVVVGITLLIVAVWFGGKRKTFTGPHINEDLLQRASVAVSNGEPAEDAKTGQSTVESKQIHPNVGVRRGDV